MMSDEQFTLVVLRQYKSDSRETITETIKGEAAYIIEQIDVLLADPLLVSMSLERVAQEVSPTPQMLDNVNRYLS